MTRTWEAWERLCRGVRTRRFGVRRKALGTGDGAGGGTEKRLRRRWDERPRRKADSSCRSVLGGRAVEDEVCVGDGDAAVSSTSAVVGKGKVQVERGPGPGVATGGGPNSRAGRSAGRGGYGARHAQKQAAITPRQASIQARQQDCWPTIAASQSRSQPPLFPSPLITAPAAGSTLHLRRRCVQGIAITARRLEL